jgi:hypothetical protein
MDKFRGSRCLLDTFEDELHALSAALPGQVEPRNAQVRPVVPSFQSIGPGKEVVGIKTTDLSQLRILERLLEQGTEDEVGPATFLHRGRKHT